MVRLGADVLIVVIVHDGEVLAPAARTQQGPGEREQVILFELERCKEGCISDTDMEDRHIASVWTQRRRRQPHGMLPHRAR